MNVIWDFSPQAHSAPQVALSGRWWPPKETEMFLLAIPWLDATSPANFSGAEDAWCSREI
jgi:hypothetical protein